MKNNMKCGLLSVLLLCHAYAHTASFTVTNTNDSGAGSLRQAIIDANAVVGPNTINFALSGTLPQVITLFSPLNALAQQITVDGTSQTGYNGTPVVILQGSQTFNAGLQAAFNQVVIKGLRIVGFSRGVIISTAQQVTVTLNELVAHSEGLLLDNAQENTISHNVITQNSDNGIFAFNGSTSNQILQNVIDINKSAGIYFDASAPDNLVQENMITNNGGFGVRSVGAQNVILTNSIFNNTLNGILTGGFPLITITFTQVNYQVIANVPTISIQGTLKGQPGALFKLQFFENAFNRAPITEGERFLGELQDVSLDSDGNATFFARFDLVDPINLPSFISATATEQLLGPIIPDKATSEFTQNYPILSFESPISLAVKAKYCS